tara:strand:- start:190 stop:501 length:312 start_codon:yes stop_codon:yes gene_type:complete
MTNTMTAAGYIISDNEGTIHGFGATVDLAWADAEATLATAQIVMLSDDDDSTEQNGSWTRRSGLMVHPATAALIEEIDAKGGACGWRAVGGVACSIEESREAA